MTQPAIPYAQRVSTAVLCMVLAMVSITTGASLAKTIFPVIGPEAVTSLRLGFAAIILFAIWRPWKRIPKGKEWRTVLFYGASLGTMNLIFYMAIARVPLGVALALQFTGPLSVALFGSRSVRDLIWVACALGGIYLLLPVATSSAHLDPWGVAFALISGIFWALYIIAGKRAGGLGHGGSIVAWGMAVGALVTLPVSTYVADFDAFTGSILLIALGIAVLSSAIPYTLEMVALKVLPSKVFSILTSLEPAVGAMAGFIFLSEWLTATQWLAILLVVTASAGSTLFAKKPKLPEIAG